MSTRAGFSASGFLKTSLVEIASAVIKIVLPVDPNFEKNDATDLEEVIIQDILIPNPF